MVHPGQRVEVNVGHSSASIAESGTSREGRYEWKLHALRVRLSRDATARIYPRMPKLILLTSTRCPSGSAAGGTRHRDRTGLCPQPTSHAEWIMRPGEDRSPPLRGFGGDGAWRRGYSAPSYLICSGHVSGSRFGAASCCGDGGYRPVAALSRNAAIYCRKGAMFFHARGVLRAGHTACIPFDFVEKPTDSKCSQCFATTAGAPPPSERKRAISRIGSGA